MGRTVGQVRIFVCKTCGHEVHEGLYKWRKKPQKKKNVCLNCIGRQEVARNDARERAIFAPYLYLK